MFIKILKAINWMFSASILIIILIIIVGNTIIYQKNKDYMPFQKADSIIILGTRIEGEPLRPSTMLQSRLDKALDYWRSNPDIILVTSGDKIQGYATSEAVIMQQYLIKKGVPAEQIFIEEQSTRTAHQFINSSKIVIANGKTLGHTVIITNDFHLPRSMMLASRSGLSSISGFASQTPTDTGSLITAYIREPFALLNSFLFDHPS